jgi:hypothetical protein
MYKTTSRNLMQHEVFQNKGVDPGYKPENCGRKRKSDRTHQMDSGLSGNPQWLRR